MEYSNFRLFAANRNGKQKFVFLGRQTKSGNRRVLFQQTYPSMHTYCMVPLKVFFSLQQEFLRNYSLPKAPKVTFDFSGSKRRAQAYGK
jgi:hypothetical protein